MLTRKDCPHHIYLSGIGTCSHPYASPELYYYYMIQAVTIVVLLPHCLDKKIKAVYPDYQYIWYYFKIYD